eukprot:scaffold49653_cov58-Phaeocystis_antarctica.AAC.2
MAVAEVEDLERLEHACHGLGDQSGQPPVADQIAAHAESQLEHLNRGYRPFGESGGEGGGGLVSDLCRGEGEDDERGQDTVVEGRRQHMHAFAAAIVTLDEEGDEIRQRATADEGTEPPPVGEGEGLVVMAAQLQGVRVT